MFLLMLISLLLLCSLRFSFHAQHADETAGCIEVRFLLFHLRFPFRVERTAHGGHRLTFLPHRPQDQPRPANPTDLQQGMTMLRALRRSDKARALLHRSLHLHALTLILRPAFSDAAANALATGVLRSAAVFVPPSVRDRVYIAVLPDFFSGRSMGYIRCMVSARLGILLIIGGMAWLSYHKEQRRQSPAHEEA